MPEVYEFLEGERIKYAIRLPANQVLQSRIGYLLTRPVGRPPHHVRRFHANFTYQAGTWTEPRRVIAKVGWHPGELYPRVGFIVTNMSRPAERVVANKRGTCEQLDQGGQRRDQVDATVVPNVRRQRGAAPTSCARLQSRQFLAHAGYARAEQGSVTDNMKEKLVKKGAKVVSHGRYVAFQMAEVAIPRQMFQEILRLIAELRPQPPPAPAGDVRWSCIQQQQTEGVRPNARENGQIRPSTPLGRPWRARRSCPHPHSGFQAIRKSVQCTSVRGSSGEYRLIGPRRLIWRKRSERK